MRQFTFICTCLLLLVTSVTKSQDKFVVNGFVKGYEEDGKIKLIINKILSNHNVDMVNEQIIYMNDGKFKFEGEVSCPTKYSIRIRPELTDNSDTRSYENTTIWIDKNKTMSLVAEKGNFRYCDLSGSKIQDLNEAFSKIKRAKVDELRARMASLYKIKDPSPEERRELEGLRSGEPFRILRQLSLDYCYSNPNNFISVNIYSSHIKYTPEHTPKSKATAFYNSLNDTLKQSVYGQQIKYYIDDISVNKVLEIGDEPYDFALSDSIGNSISLNSLKGKVILLDFWTSGCGPCRIEHKNYLANYKKYKDQGFEILSVSSDRSKARWTNAMQEDQMIWKSVLDIDSSITNYMYLVSFFPTNYLINREGVIIAKNIRGSDLTDKLTEMLDTK